LPAVLKAGPVADLAVEDDAGEGAEAARLVRVGGRLQFFA
jgi:hypothetical protein